MDVRHHIIFSSLQWTLPTFPINVFISAENCFNSKPPQLPWTDLFRQESDIPWSADIEEKANFVFTKIPPRIRFGIPHPSFNKDFRNMLIITERELLSNLYGYVHQVSLVCCGILFVSTVKAILVGCAHSVTGFVEYCPPRWPDNWMQILFQPCCSANEQICSALQVLPKGKKVFCQLVSIASFLIHIKEVDVGSYVDDHHLTGVDTPYNL